MIKKVIDGFPNYEITYSGKIISNTRSNTKYLKPIVKDNDYLYINLWNKGKQSQFLLHRLVAIYFVPNPLNKKYVNHKDADKENVCADNLEWVTSSENTIHAFENDLLPHGEDHHYCKITDKDVKEIIKRYKNENISQAKLAEDYDTTQSNISLIVLGKTRKHIK